MKLFNRSKYATNQARANIYLKDYKFLSYASEDIISRLESINRQFTQILDIGCKEGYLSSLLNNLYPTANVISTNIIAINSQKIIVLDEENIDYSDCDLITYCHGLHFINSPQDFLKKIANSLTKDGIFIANFIGGNSLRNLRLKFIEVEEYVKKPHSSHVSPFIRFDHLPPLLYGAGFKEIIVDYEKIKLEYKSPLSLIQDLNKYGESNCLAQISNYSISKAMMPLLADESQIFEDEITLISVIASLSKGGIKIL